MPCFIQDLHGHAEETYLVLYSAFQHCCYIPDYMISVLEMVRMIYLLLSLTHSHCLLLDACMPNLSFEISAKTTIIPTYHKHCL